MSADERITDEELAELAKAFSELKGVQLKLLRLPGAILGAFEPSQIGTIIGTLMDVCIPELPTLLQDEPTNFGDMGLSKHEGILGEREGYPDYRHTTGKRLELKLLYKDPQNVEMKKPPTPREPSARLTQKVTVKNVNPKTDALMVLAYQLRSIAEEPNSYSPTIVDVGLFPMIDCILARDDRLERSGGKWFGEYETPCILSNQGKRKLLQGTLLDDSQYGRKEAEGKDFNEDTNFGKLKRVPYKPLQQFLKKHGASYAAKGYWPSPWKITPEDCGEMRELMGSL